MTEETEVPGLIPGLAYTFVKADHEIFSMDIPLSVPNHLFSLIKERQLSLLAKVWPFSTGKPLKRSKPGQEYCG